MNPDTWLSFFEVLSIGAGVLAVAALIGTVVMGKKANARQAERILTLETGLADAKTKQAEAERRLLEVQNRIAWRHSFDERKFREVLDRGVKGTAEIVYLKDDSEANIFAESLWFALAASGWRVDQPRPGKDSPDSRMPFFLREAGVLVTNMPQLAVAVSNQDELVAKPYSLDTPSGSLMAAFEAVELQPLHEVLDHGMPPSGAIKIVVGSRF